MALASWLALGDNLTPSNFCQATLLVGLLLLSAGLGVLPVVTLEISLKLRFVCLSDILVSGLVGVISAVYQKLYWLISMS